MSNISNFRKIVAMIRKRKNNDDKTINDESESETRSRQVALYAAKLRITAMALTQTLVTKIWVHSVKRLFTFFVSPNFV